ncbi:MAG: ABC transporter substrate-binding protein [Synergistaceae bacterium]|jgi:peptide/nickel transport system substrate-binding protein|nr:ABC transporter substrate-binding protein [Synergistaceae bacterium]
MKRFFERAALLSAAVVIFAMCGRGFPAAGADVRTLNLSTLAPLTTVDPHNTTNLQDITFLKQVFEPLVFQNEATGDYELRIAEGYSVAPDGLAYTFNIRKGVKFHNGRDLKASDVVFSLKRAAENPKVRNYLVTVADVSAPDEYTVVVKLKQPNAAFLNNQNMVFIVNRAEVEEQGEEFGTKLTLAGTGPYFLTSLKHDVEWTCDAFPAYYRGEAPIKKLHYVPITDASAGLIAFESGELDWYIAPIANWDALSSNPKYKTELVPANHISFICVNYLKKPLDDDNLRKAIAYAIDKDAMNIAVFSGHAVNADFLIGAQNTGAPTTGIVYDYDLQKAKEYLAKSAYPKGTHIGSINCSAGGNYEKMAVVLQANLAEIGLTCDINRLESATNLEYARTQKFDLLATGGEVVGDFDAWRLYCDTRAVGAYYVKYEGGKFDYKKMDKLWDDGISVADTAKRKEIYTELNNMIMDTATMLPVFHRPTPFVWTTDLNIPRNYSIFPQVYEWSWK